MLCDCEPFVLFAVENLNSTLISARFVGILNIGRLFVTVFIFNLLVLSLNQVNEHQNQFIDGEGFHIHDTLMQS